LGKFCFIALGGDQTILQLLLKDFISVPQAAVLIKGEVTPAPVPVSVSVFEPQSTSDTGTGTFRVVPLVPAPSLAPTQSMGYLLL